MSVHYSRCAKFWKLMKNMHHRYVGSNFIDVMGSLIVSNWIIFINPVELCFTVSNLESKMLNRVVFALQPQLVVVCQQQAILQSHGISIWKKLCIFSHHSESPAQPAPHCQISSSTTSTQLTPIWLWLCRDRFLWCIITMSTCNEASVWYKGC